MKALISEYGHLLIVLITSSVIMVAVIFGIAMPQMKAHTESVIPENSIDTHVDFAAFNAIVTRHAPTITVPEFNITSGATISFAEYLNAGRIKAINADGNDVSNSIKISPADDAAASYYDDNLMTFKNAPAGEYEFVISAKDITDTEYYGKKKTQHFSVLVEGTNLIPYPYSTESDTQCGINFTVSDRSVGLSGTASETYNFFLYGGPDVLDFSLSAGTYKLSGMGTVSNASLCVVQYDGELNVLAVLNGGTDSITFTIAENCTGIWVYLAVQNGDSPSGTAQPSLALCE